jgi:hypothetical protein
LRTVRFLSLSLQLQPLFTHLLLKYRSYTGLHSFQP